MATTLATLLIKLGFDITGLAAGGAQAQQTLNGVAGAAGNVATMAAPAAAALNNLQRAIDGVAKSRGASNTARSLADAAAAVAVNTNNSTAAMNAFARGASAIANATGSATAVNSYARAIGDIATATKDPKQVQTFATNAANGAALMANQAGGVQKLVNSFKAASANAPAMAAAMQAAGAGANAAGAGGHNAAAGANAAAAGMNSASAASVRAAANFNNAAKSMDIAANRGSFLNRVLSMAFAFGGGVAVTTVFGFIASAIIGFNSRLEQSHIAFETLIGDAQSADKFIAKMLRFASVTPFDFAGLEDAAQRLMALGFTADQVLPVLTAVGDAVAALGGNKEKLDRIVLALGQMLTAGRVNAQDMRQLTEAGIPAWQILGDAIGKTVAETRKMAEGGLIPATQAVEVLVRGMEAKFGGLMAKQARTAAGAFTTIRDKALELISGAVKPAFDLISQGMVGLADFLTSGGGKYIAPAIAAIGIAIGNFLIPRVLGLMVTLVPLSSMLVALTTLFFVWQENIGGLRDALSPVVDTILKVVVGFVEFASKTGLLTTAVAGLVTLITGRFILSMLASAGAMIFNVGAAIALSGAFTGLTVSAGGAAIGAVGLRAALVGMAAASGPLLILVAVLSVVMAIADNLPKAIDSFGEAMDALAHKDLPAATKATEDLVNSMLGIMQVLPLGNAFVALVRQLTGIKPPEPISIETEIKSVAEEMRAEMDAALAAFSLGSEQFVVEGQSLVTRFGQTLQGVVDAARVAGGEAMRTMADEILANQQAPVDALVALRAAVANALNPMQEIARLNGILLSGEIERGIATGIPAVVAAAEALRIGTVEQLDAITDGAYSASLAIAQLLEMQAAIMRAPPSANIDREGIDISALNEQVAETKRLADIWNNRYKPGVDASTAAMDKLNKELAETASNSAMVSALSSAFNDIKSTAHAFFQQTHQDNLQLIDDALKHKNAILDAKAALNQAPVTAAQKALDFQRRQIEEWRLRNSIATAQSPEAYRDAVLALQDFLAQSHIDDMQAQVDAANAKLEEQKKHNQDKADDQRSAEDERYRLQVAAFDRDLALLEQSLIAQKGAWQTGQDQILELLAGYGVNFASVGAGLGSTFTANLKDQIDAAIAALKLASDGLANIDSEAQLQKRRPNLSQGNFGADLMQMPMVPPAAGHSTGGTWDHIDPATGMPWVSPLMPATMPPNYTGGPASFGSAFSQMTTGSVPTGNVGGGTMVLKVGEDVFGEITDERLAVQNNIYGSQPITLSSQR